MRSFLLITLLTLCLFNCNGQNGIVENRTYFSNQVEPGVILIDGQIDEAWSTAQWSDNFVDIEGAKQPRPHLDTRVKMLWDTNYFYVLAELEEPHVWATLSERDDIIFYDNDFELFIDPDGDTHHYTEIEINAFNTVWDLILTKPYRDKGNALHQFDLKGLQTAVHIDGTINDPSDKDNGWIVEIAIPWKSLHETTSLKLPPKNNQYWRVNFSRVQWETEVIDDRYIKVIDPETGKSKKEMNWVWSPQRVINMHEPEFWGTVVFKTFNRSRESYYADFISEEIRQRLYEIHRNQISIKKKSGVFQASKENLLSVDQFITGDPIMWDLRGDQSTYHIIMQHPRDAMLFWHLDHTGKLWREIRE